jgi:hypothetical protein
MIPTLRELGSPQYYPQKDATFKKKRKVVVMT